MEKTWFMAPMEKTLRPQCNIPSWFIPLWFYERLCFDVVIAMVKDKNKSSIKEIQSKLFLCIT